VLSARLARVAAWAPGVESAEAWRDWAQAPRALAAEGAPDGRFLPPLLRRRCTALSRIMLTAAFGCGEAPEIAGWRTVFASRHGSINESIGLLEALAHDDKISPAIFSHTVHNAQAGLFSIAAGNRHASSSLSAMEETFPSGFLEALTHLEREPARPVLLVVGDVPLAPTFAPLVDEAATAYALALLLSAQGAGEPVRLALEPSDAKPARRAWPDALEFLRFWLSGEAELDLPGRGHRWRFARG
jgi:hypothetical protein